MVWGAMDLVVISSGKRLGSKRTGVMGGILILLSHVCLSLPFFSLSLRPLFFHTASTTCFIPPPTPLT